MRRMAEYTGEFFDGLQKGALSSARAVLPLVFEHLTPGTAVDIGCGTGCWLRVAEDLGATGVLGVDGAYLDPNSLLIGAQDFTALDLETDSFGAHLVEAHGAFDLCLCLEVAEHLPPARAASFVEQLCTLSDVIVFSAAVPGQRGLNHVNEQWPDYWSRLFHGRDFACFDMLRFDVWENMDVNWWYIQNLLVFCRRKSEGYDKLSLAFGEASPPRALVHPRLFTRSAVREATALVQLERCRRKARRLKAGLEKGAGRSAPST